MRVETAPDPRHGETRRVGHGNDYVTIKPLSILEYLDPAGSSPFAAWFQSLDAAAAAKVTTALRRLELGNFSNVKGVGAGVFDAVVILLCGGTKKRQDRDIAMAHDRWGDYKKRKAEER